jgi:hypothetical protein
VIQITISFGTQNYVITQLYSLTAVGMIIAKAIGCGFTGAKWLRVLI